MTTTITSSSSALRSADVVRFWVPLCATWLMMSVEGPILTSVIARLVDPTFNLAAYGVAVAVAMFIEAPVIMLLSTTVALAVDGNAYRRLRSFMWQVNGLVTAGMLVVSIPWVFDVMAYHVLLLPDEIADRMYWAFVCMIPWPAAIGYRRFYQGLLIRNGLTRHVAWGTVVRLCTMAATALLLTTLSMLPGAVIGTLSLSTGVVFEALATRRMSRGIVRRLRRQRAVDCAPTPPMREILRFYIPLALTSIIGFVVTPMLAFFMGRAPESVASLAILPVVDSFVFMFRSFGFSYQEVGIALLGEGNKNYRVVRRVGVGIAVATTVVLAVVALTPVSEIVFGSVYGLVPALADMAVLPTIILVPLPALAVVYSVQRAVLINARQNVVVTWSTIAEIAAIAAVMIVMTATTGVIGAVAAAIAMTAGRVFANGYLWVRTRQALA